MGKAFLVVMALFAVIFLSGCAAVVQGGAALAAGSAKSKPANESFEVRGSASEAFNVSMRALSASGRKVTLSDRESGIIQGEVEDYAVVIKIASKGGGGAVVDLTVAYNQSFIYGAAQMDVLLAKLKGEIEEATKAVRESPAGAAPAAPVVTGGKVTRSKVTRSKVAVRE